MRHRSLSVARAHSNQQHKQTMRHSSRVLARAQLQRQTMPHLPANNIELYYEQHGTGPDLILIGGLTSDHNIWRSTIRPLSPHFRILIFDNRGSGQSSTPDYPYT